MDGGKTWEWFEPDPNNESSCHYIAFDPENVNHIFISGEYAIYESYDCGETWDIALDDMVSDPILGYSYNIMYDLNDSNKATIYSVGHYNGKPSRNIVRSIDNGKTWQQCFNYDFNGEINFFFDAILFDGKIWIYDYKDIVYWDINNSSNINLPLYENSQSTEYYVLNSIRLNTKPSSGIVIEKQGNASKVIGYK